jgi:hypothetical protein
MTININIKRRFKINGKEYNSIEEMPDNVREAFKKAMDSRSGSEFPAGTQTRIIFNGTEYENIEAMPQDIRLLYEKMLKAAETGNIPRILISQESARARSIKIESSGLSLQEMVHSNPRSNPPSP